MSLAKFSPRDIDAKEPCWSLEEINQLFRNVLKKREMDLNDAFRLYRGKEINPTDLQWLLLNFSPKEWIHEAAELARNAKRKILGGTFEMREWEELYAMCPGGADPDCDDINLVADLLRLRLSSRWYFKWFHEKIIEAMKIREV